MTPCVCRFTLYEDVPIVTDCTALRHFEDLPILYSKDFSELTEEYLLENTKRLATRLTT